MTTIMKRLAILSLALTLIVSCKKSDDKAEEPTPKTAQPEVTPPPEPEAPVEAKPDLGDYKLVAMDDLEWAPMDPEQPEGIKLAVVDGNPMEDGQSTFFLQLPVKANSGLHTHTAGYRAVVVSGAPRHWLAGENEKKVAALAPASYWNQPGGQAHGDSCEGPEACVLFVIMDGKFDFAPATDVKKAKPNAAYKLVKAEDAKFALMGAEGGPSMAVLDGDPKTGPVAFVIELPAGHAAGLHTHTSDYQALVLTGSPSHWVDGADGENDELAAGTYWKQPGEQVHGDTCHGEKSCRLFAFMPKALDMMPKAE